MLILPAWRNQIAMLRLGRAEGAGHRFRGDEPHTLDEIDCEAFDLVVALSSEAHARAKELLRATSVELLYWPIEDATQVTGTRDQRIEAYRRCGILSIARSAM